MSGPSVAMFHESPSGNVEKSKLINSGQNTTCNEQNNHFYMGALGGENDVISIVQTLASHLARTSNNQSTGADGSGPLPQAVDSGDTTQVDGYQVEVCDMVPPDPSAFPVASIADQYTRAMLERLVGYPLYEPEPLSEHSTEYLCNGVNVGDVGFVREDGAFDFLFNICPPQNSSINPPNLPNGFSLVTPEHSATREMGPLSRGTCFCPSAVTKTESGEYVCKGPEGAILILPEGAIQHEAVNRGRFEELAKRHGVEWYEYTKTLGRSISNGSLYLVTSFTKCTRQWGIAVFHRSCDPRQGLRFGRKLCFLCFNSTPKYRWKGSSVFVTKVARPNQKDASNQCVLLRGYKIMIRADIFDKLCNNRPPKFDTAILSPSPQAGNGDLTQRRQQATHITGGGVTDRMSTRTRPKDAVVLHANFNSSPIHPSDIINTALLSQNPDAKIALTHDDVWCDLLRENFPKLNAAGLANITRSYKSTVDEYGCVSLKKFSDLINDESSISSPALQGPIQCPTTPNEEYTHVPTENPMPSVQERNDSVGHADAILYEVHEDTVIFQFGDGLYTEPERGMIRDYLSNVTAFTLRDIDDIMSTMKSHPLTSSILNLPYPQAAYSDYQIKNKHRSCAKGTRVPLLQEMAGWISGTDKTRIYVLSGPAEIGKSTVAYTIASRADALGILGASFFFARDGADRDNGKMFFTAIAYQLCLYNELFAKAIEAALLTKLLSDATMKDPQEQLEALILEPLRYIVRSRIRPILIVVDGLDECEEEDGVSVLAGLSQLVRDLPSFKVILTTRPKSHLDRFFHSHDDHKIFHLQDINDTIVNDDTRSCHQPTLSQELAREQLQNRAESGRASDIEDKIINDVTRSHPQPSPSQELAGEQLQDRAESRQASDIKGKALNDDTQPYLQPSPSQEVAREQLHDRAEGSDIEDKIINDDTPPCRQPSPSPQLAREQLRDRMETQESGPASDTRIGSFVRALGKHIIRTEMPSILFSENFNTGNLDEANEGKMTVAIDFGTTFSGVAYGSARIDGGNVQQILNWPGSFETFRKIPTCLLYDDYGQVLAWGLEAKNAGPIPGTIKCEWFKLFLEPHALRDASTIDPRLPRLPPGKHDIDPIIDFLSCLWEYAKDQITREIGAVADLNSADVWLTVPAAWDAKGCDIMREAAIAAGLVQSAKPGDNWRDRLHIITESEAAAVHCAFLTEAHRLRSSQNFMIVDAGGGTCDLAVYKIIGQMADLEIAEMCARSGANCGSFFLDLRFRELVETLLSDHPAHLNPASMAEFMHSFSETDKLNYKGLTDDSNMFYFNCFNVEDPNDHSVGLIDGQLCIPGNLLRKKVFDPVVSQVLNLIEEQLTRVEQRIQALLLVGGFAGNEYLKECVETQFQSRIKLIVRPPDADTATLRGAARYGLAKRQLVSSVVVPRSYVMKVKLPAEQEDWRRRPTYIRNNDAGVAICDNRLQYLVVKGVIIRKGQRLTTKFCKFSLSAKDSTFLATLFTSDTERVLRYTDEGEIIELCKWTVDLSTLPTFGQNANASLGRGFYTEFELGLELDSAEVRGILLYNNQEWGRVIFDFLN